MRYAQARRPSPIDTVIMEGLMKPGMTSDDRGNTSVAPPSIAKPNRLAVPRIGGTVQSVAVSFRADDDGRQGSGRG